MATINDPNTAANIVAVGEKATATIGAAHVCVKPIPASVGHYRVTHRFVMIAAQAANSKLFELRNAHASNLIIPTRMIIKWMTLSAHTAILEDSIDVFKVTAFTVSSTTSTVALTPSLKRASMGATSAVIKGVTVAGAAAGMTGFTATKDSGPLAQLPKILPQAAMAITETAPRDPSILDVFDDVNGTHPFVLNPNEGIMVENRVVLGAAAGSSVYIDFSYAEVTAY